MFIFLYVLAGVSLAIAKGVQVDKQIMARAYSWKGISAIAATWLILMTWSVHAIDSNLTSGWIPTVDCFISFAQRCELTHSAAEAHVLLPMLGIVVLGVYVLGHAIGWVSVGVRTLLKTDKRL